MRIRTLHLTAFGPFAGVKLDFSGPPFQLIHGDNEAGKSTTLRALLSFFLGFKDEWTPRNFAHEGLGIQLGATVLTDAGTETTLYRFRQAKSERVSDAADQPWSQERFTTEILGGVSAGFFLRFLALDHEALRAGGKELAEARGELGQALFSAASGLPGMERMLLSLDREAEELFKPKGQNPVINRLIKEFESGRAALNRTCLHHRGFQELRDNRERLFREKEALDLALNGTDAQLNRLERLRQALPLLNRRERLLREREGLLDVRLLPEEAGEERVRLETGLKAHRDEHHLLTVQLARESAALEALGLPSSVTRAEEAVSLLHQGQEAYENNRKQMEQLAREEETLAGRKATLLADFGLPQAPPLPNRRQREEIREKVARFARLTEEEGHARDEQRRAATRLDAHPPLPFPQPGTTEREILHQGLLRARGLGDVEARLAREQARVREVRERAETLNRALPLWQGTARELESLALPSRERITRRQDEEENFQKEGRRLAEERAREEKNWRGLEEELAVLLGQGELLSPEALAEVRRQRDRLWRRLRREGDSALEEAFEEAVAWADQVADRLIEAAGKVARATDLTARIEGARVRLQRIAGKEAERAQALAAWRQAWREEWTFLAAPPLAPAEMLAWRVQVEEIRDRLEEAARLAVDSRLFAEQWRQWKEEILRHWPSGAGNDALKEGAAAALLDAGDALLRDLDRRETEAVGRHKAREGLIAELGMAERKLAEAQEALAAFSEQWVRFHPWSEGGRISPVGMAVHLSFWEEMESIEGELARKRLDRTRLGEETRRFARQAEELATRFLPEVAGESPERQSRLLHAALTEARRLEERRTMLGQSREELSGRLRRKEEEIARLLREWEGLLNRADCQDGAALATAIDRSNQRRGVERDLTVIEERLLDLAASEGVENLAQRAREADVDALPRERERLAEERERLREERERTQRRLWEVEERLTALPGEETAQEQALAQRSILVDLAEETERFLVLRLARELAKLGFQRFRERRKNPRVARAGEFFARLTLGSFTTLQAVSDGKGGSQVAGIRPHGLEVPVTAMSDGARDQLYLSLRLAAIEAHFQDHPPLPLILDDLLIHFDDQRAKAALAILGEFADKTQVLFFTHHQRLRELAREVLGEERMRTHELRPLLAK